MRTDRPEDDKGPPRSPAGRPRDGKIDAAIIQATRDLLLETGYSALSLSAIAARAGTTTAAIYRRWSGKAQLVHEAILPAEVMAMPSASGDVVEDIRALVEATRTMFDRPEVRLALPALIADTVADPDVHSAMTLAIRRQSRHLPDQNRPGSRPAQRRWRPAAARRSRCRQCDIPHHRSARRPAGRMRGWTI